MSVIHDDLDELFGGILSGISPQRLQICVCLYLAKCTTIPVDPNRCGDYAYRDELARVFSRNAALLDATKTFIANNVAEESHLTWLKEDRRQTEWVYNRILKTQQNTVPLFNALTGRERALALIDMTICSNLTEKITGIQQTAFEWDYHLQNNHLFRWFADDKEGSERRKFATEYLRKKGYPSIDKLEKMEDVYIFFDRGIFDRNFINDQIRLISTAWRAQKRRNGLQKKGKEQYNFVLSDNTNRHLNVLAKRYDLSRTDVLELLVKLEAETGVHLKEYKLRIEAHRKVLEAEPPPAAPPLNDLEGLPS